MSEATDQVLTRAYELIESDQLDEARTLLDPVLETDKNNADAWWLYAHAVRDRDTARNALQNVLRIDPAFSDARDLLNTLEASAHPTTPVLSSIRPIGAVPQPPTIPDLPPTLTEKADDTWGFDEMGVDKPKPSGLTPRRLALLIPILVIVLVVGLLLILNPAGAPTAVSTVPPTADIAGVPTLPVTGFTPVPLDTVVSSSVTEEIGSMDQTPAAISNGTDESPPADETPLEAVATAETLVVTDMPDFTTLEAPVSPAVQTGETDFQPIYDALNNFILPRESIEIAQTGLGQTLLVNICTVAGPEMRAALPAAMNAIASVSDTLETSVDAIGARMLNCGSNTVLRVIGVRLQDAVAFANGDLNEQEFQARWESQ